ncbi:hypothetical protein NDU88_006355 [Pleurodeles waltl]|uniref:Uncharacterized protein n=1 Tax=Pleurodeles waltl TaxID=8319 RepID=A0AAV7X117_PLEWA|nr:hypothetical protein NDU88_006355 [Pleurodeles waltl]
MTRWHGGAGPEYYDHIRPWGRRCLEGHQGAQWRLRRVSCGGNLHTCTVPDLGEAELRPGTKDSAGGSLVEHASGPGPVSRRSGCAEVCHLEASEEPHHCIPRRLMRLCGLGGRQRAPATL